MYLEDSPFQRDQIINIDQVIGRALDRGINLGENHHQTIEKYVSLNLIPRLVNGEFPATVVDRLEAVDNLIKQGKSIDEVQKIIRDERRRFLSRPLDLPSLVDTYKKASKSLLMLSILALVIYFGATGLSNSSNPVAQQVVGKPVGNVLAAFIRQAKTDPNSTDPLGLTNINKVITVNERHEVVIQKTINQTQASVNNADLKVDNLDIKNIISQELAFPNIATGGKDCVLGLTTTHALYCDSSTIYWTKNSIKGIADASVLSGLQSLSITGNGIKVNRTDNAFSLSLANEAIASIAGVKNNGGDVAFIAGAGVTITPNDTNNTVTFSLAGSGVNADLLDGLDSTQFLRSDNSANFTSGTLTLNAGTTLSVLGTFSCSNCIPDAAIPDTITVSNYLPLAGGTMAGNINFNSNLATNIGAAGTNFTSGGGLNIATDLGVGAHAAIGNNASVTSSKSLYIDQSFTGNGTSIGEHLNTYYTGVNPFQVLRGLSTYTNWQGGVGSSAGIVSGVDIQANQFANTAITSLLGSDISIGSQTGTTGAVTTAYGLNLSKTWLGSIPTTVYGLNIGNFGNAGTTTSYGIYLANQTGSTTNYSIYSAGGLNYFAGAITASAGSTTAVGFNLNTAQAGPACASLANGDFGFDSTNNRIYWKGTGGTCSYWNRTGTFDIAEHTPASESTESGDILVIDTSSPTFAVKKSTAPYQQTVVGIESTDPTLVSNPEALGKTNFVSKMALAGRVPTKVSTENGPILTGDYLTTSSTPGVAMKATKTGPTIGKALEGFTGTGVGKILVFVSVSFYLNPNDFNAYTINSNSNLATKLGVGAKFVWENSSGKIVASISDLGEAIFSKVTADIANFGKLVFGEAVVKKSAKTAGQDTIPTGQNEIFVQSYKVKGDSLINLTPTSEPDGILYIKDKKPGSGFTVGVKRLDPKSAQAINFSWFILNQE